LIGNNIEKYSHSVLNHVYSNFLWTENKRIWYNVSLESLQLEVLSRSLIVMVINPYFNDDKLLLSAFSAILLVRF
jgi:hypothetical protein